MLWRHLLASVIVYLVSLTLLIAVDRMCGHETFTVKMAVAALLGGVHAYLCILRGFSFMAGTLWYFVILIAMGMVAYDCDMKRTLRFTALQFILGTFAQNLNNRSTWTSLIVGGMILLLCMIGQKYDGERKDYVSVRIPSPSGELSVMALCDSGNMLLDPLTGQSVLIVSASVSRQLTGLTTGELENPVNTVLSKNGLRLIPYHTVGNNGFLLAKKMDNVTINNKTGSILVAFSPKEIGSNKGFQALTGGAA